jgi:hypothetical protein
MLAMRILRDIFIGYYLLDIFSAISIDLGLYSYFTPASFNLLFIATETSAAVAEAPPA